MRIGLLISWFALLLFGVIGTAHAKPSLRVTPNKSQMSVQEYLVLDIDFEVQGGAKDPTLKPPPLTDWKRVRVETSGTQQSISIINGSVSRSFSKRERWILKPLKAGRLPIGPFELVGADGRVQTPIRYVSVVGKISPQTQQQSVRSSKGRIGTEPSVNAKQAKLDEGIFLRWKYNNASPYVGEPILVHLELLYDPRLRPTHSSGLEKLDFSGFWTKKIDQPEQREWAEEIKGTEFRVQRLISYHLVPLDTQDRALPSVSMRVELSTIQRRSGSFLGRQTLVPWGEVNAKSARVPLKIRPLPTQNRPKPFPRTSVGQTSVRAKLSQRRVRADSGVDLTIETITDGLLQNFPELVLSEISDFDVYPSQTTDSSNLNRNGSRSGDGVVIRNVRRQTFLLRPKKVGRLIVPAVELPYFNPKSERYETARTRPLSVQVYGVVPSSPDVQSEAQQPQAKTPKNRKGFRPLNRSPKVVEESHWMGNIGVFYGFAFGLPSLLGLLALVRRRRRLLERTQGSRSAAKALKAAKNSLEALRTDSAVSLKDKAKAAKGVSLRYLEQRTQLNLMGFAYDELASELEKIGVSGDDLRRFVELLETLDYESFSGNLSGSSFETQVDELGRLLQRFETALERI